MRHLKALTKISFFAEFARRLFDGFSGSALLTPMSPATSRTALSGADDATRLRSVFSVPLRN